MDEDRQSSEPFWFFSEKWVPILNAVEHNKCGFHNWHPLAIKKKPAAAN